MPRISLAFIIIIAVSYLVGAKWPVLAQKVGLA